MENSLPTEDQIMALGQKVASYHVYVLAERNMFSGKLDLHEKGIHFWTRDDLKSDALAIGGALTFGVGVAKRSYKDFIIPYKEVGSATMEKKLLIMKNLVVMTKSGEKLVFRFGVLSPQKAIDLIMSKM